MADIVNVIAIILFLLCWALIIKNFFVGRSKKVKTVKAKVVDKYNSQMVSNYPGTFKNEHYTIVFETGHKKLSFEVSEFSYRNYKINQKGTLKYKGRRIISFE